MSFRQFGGMNYAARHNAVSSNYNTANNLLVTQNVGQAGSYINFLSDISGNISLYGDLDISGNVYISGSLNVDGEITGPTGSFTYLSASQQILAPAGITGATGSFTYLSASQGITGPTGSFQTLAVNGNANISGYISTGGVYWYGTIGSGQSVSSGSTSGITLSLTSGSTYNTFYSTGVSSSTTSFTCYYPSSSYTVTTNPIVVPTGAYGVYSVSINVNLNGTTTTTGLVTLIICQTSSSGTIVGCSATESYLNTTGDELVNITQASGLFQYTSGNSGNYFSFIFANSSTVSLTLDGNSQNSNVQLYKIA
jgi:hypothetical protein